MRSSVVGADPGAAVGLAVRVRILGRHVAIIAAMSDRNPGLSSGSDRPRIVLIHGSAADQTTWQIQLASLARSCASGSR